MTLLGLDFDNTLVEYDEAFHQLALEKKLITNLVPADNSNQNYLREEGKGGIYLNARRNIWK